MTAITSYATITARVKDHGRELKAYREAHGVSLITAAQRAGMPVADCRAIEAGHTAVPVYSWLRYADALGLRLGVVGCGTPGHLGACPGPRCPVGEATA